METSRWIDIPYQGLKHSRLLVVGTCLNSTRLLFASLFSDFCLPVLQSPTWGPFS